MLKNKIILLLILSIFFAGCNDTDNTNDDIAENITYQIDNEPPVVITDGIDAFQEDGIFYISAGEMNTPEGFGIEFYADSPHGYHFLYGPGIDTEPTTYTISQFDVSNYGLPGEYIDVTISMDFFTSLDFDTLHHFTGTVHVLRDN